MLAFLLVMLLYAVNPASAQGKTQSKISSSLALLLSLHREHPDCIPLDALAFSDSAGARVILRCNRQLNEEDSNHLRRLGLKLNDSESRIPKGLLKGCHLPWQALQALGNLPFIDAIDSAWQPGVIQTLDLSAQVVKATQVWEMSGPGGGPRVVVADFDTGVDVFHPSLWYADDTEYNWIDTDGNLSFTPGVDTVDLNGNGGPDSNEHLNYLKGSVKDYAGVVTNSSGPFAANLDWLYNDANSNGIRDYGVSFGESTPTYGERIFVPHDSNGNGSFDLGEKVVGLNSSKVSAVLGPYGATFFRGSNLIQCPADTNGHGTAVCGILGSRNPHLGKYVGISPDTDIVVADRTKNDFTQYIAWAESRGAKVMLYEFGGWTFQFMDGSSPLEQAISSEWDKGIVQVVPAGNLGDGKKHADVNISNGSGSFEFTVPSKSGINTVYLTVLWRTSRDDLSFTLTNPSGAQTALPGNQTFYTDPSGNLYWSYGIQQSVRGTRRFDVYISKSSGLTTGNWSLRAAVPGGKGFHLHAYVSDNLAGWTGGVTFKNGTSKSVTVTWPATADKALVVGSFSTRGIKVAAGQISTFSGKGPRIDGADIVSVCAPGNYDIFTPCSKDAGNPFGGYREFSGTSASGAHVAAGCALLLQLNPALSADEVSVLIRSSAASDTYTGAIPNSLWGYGKLDVAAAAMGALNDALETAAHMKTLPDGVSVSPFGKLVVAAWGDRGYFYIEESDRSSGIKVLGTGVAEGDKISLSGTMTTVGVERAVQAQSINVIQHYQNLPKSLAMTNVTVGNSPAGNEGLDNTGLLITTWGRIIASGVQEFVITDGSPAEVHVSAVGIIPPGIGNFAVVTGISSLGIDQNGVYRFLLPRRQSDVIVIR